MDSFFPEGYEVPTAESGYMKLQLGDNKFRILDKPIMGSEWWVTDGDSRKPVRKRIGEKIQVGEVEGDIKHFWAFPVWNYGVSRIQILEITQKSIQTEMNKLINNPKWGSPMNYDFNIGRTGEGMETRYSVQPEPPETLPKEIVDMYKNTSIHLEALYEGGDPFAETTSTSAQTVNDEEIPL